MSYRYAVLIPADGLNEYTFKAFSTQDDLKSWIKSNPNITFTVIEYQELPVQVETVVTFKRPVSSRTS